MGAATGAHGLTRPGVVLGGAAACLLAQRVAISGGQLAIGSTGLLLSRLDLAGGLVLAVGAFAVTSPWVAGPAADAPYTSPVRVLVRRLVALYLAWWLTVAFAVAAVGEPSGTGRLMLTLVAFRPLGAPLPGLSVGPLLLTLAATAVLVPTAVALLPEARRSTRTQLRGAGALVLAGLAFRVACAASGATSTFGPLSYLPAHLHLVGVGVAGAALRGAVLRGSVDCRRVRQLRRAGAAVATASFAAATWILGLPRTPVLTDAGDVVVHSLCGAAVAAGVLIAALLPSTATSPTPRWLPGGHRTAVAIAIAAPGLLLVNEPAFWLVARQYRERVIRADGGLFLRGNLVAPFIWSLCIAVAAGIVLAAGAAAAGRLARHRRREAVLSPLTFAGVVATGFFVRVYALLAVAPERTDGGDPLYYHTTANLLARARGFPEPLNWIAYQRQIPSALHGPLYPLVLSISSRFGGTGYFDHKMTSVVVGTVLVAAIGVLGRRVGGPLVALVAAAIAAVYPNLWLIDGVLYPEGLFALLVTCSLLAAYRWRATPRLRFAALLGAAIALAALTRGEGILLAPLLALPFVLLHRAVPWRTRVRHLAVAGVACAAVLAPWTIRNATTFSTFVPLSTNGNELLVYSNCDTAWHGRLAGFWDYGCQEAVRAQLGEPAGDEAQRALYWRDHGLDYVKHHLGGLPRVVTLRVLRQWELYRPLQNVSLTAIEGRNQAAGLGGLAMFYGLAGLSVAGAIGLRRRRVPLLPLGATFVVVTITAAYTYGTERFRAAAEPSLVVLAAVGLVPLIRRAATSLTARRPHAPSFDHGAFVAGGSGGLRVRRGGAVQHAALRTWLGIGSVLAVVAPPLRGLYHTTGGTMEEGFMLVFPERLLKGDVPNVDFLHLYGPGSLHALAGWYKLFGVTLEAERTFGLVQHLGIVFALFTLARPWGRLAATAVASLSVLYILTPIGLTAMAWNGGLALALWSVVFALRARSRPDPRRSLVVAGVLAGLALTFRPDLALALLVVGVWFLWRNPWWRRAAMGAAVGLAPMWAHVAIAGPTASFRGMVTDPVFRLRAGRELPRPPSWGHLDGSLQAIAELIPPWWKVPALPASQELFLWFFAALAAPVVLLVIARRLRRHSAGSPLAATLTAGGLFSLGIVPQALQRPDSTHLCWVTCVSFPLLVLGIVEVLRTRAPRLNARARTTWGVAALVALTLLVAPLFTFRYYLLHTRVSLGNVPPAFVVERDGRRFYLGDDAPHLASRAAIADLDRWSSPGQTLLVGPHDLRRTWYSDSFFYYMFPELPPATYFIEMDPGIANAAGSPLAREVAAADWVLLTRFWDGWREPNASADFGSDAPNAALARHFCLAGSYQDGLVALYRRCRP